MAAARGVGGWGLGEALEEGDVYVGVGADEFQEGIGNLSLKRSLVIKLTSRND